MSYHGQRWGSGRVSLGESETAEVGSLNSLPARNMP